MRLSRSIGFLCLLAVLGCTTSDSQGAPPLSPEQFAAETAAHADGDETEGRSGAVAVLVEGVPTEQAPAALTPAEFAEATAAHDDGEEAKGRGTPTLQPAPEHVDDFGSPPAMAREAFSLATRQDLAREEDEEGDARPTPPAAAMFEITLQRAFMERCKNRATLTADFQVMGASNVHKISKGGDDGDIHMGGVSDDIGLPLVAEIMNAKGQTAIVNRIKQFVTDEETITVSGTWRLWCEHPGVPQIQFDTQLSGPPSNPDHVFELHPVTKLDGTDLKSTFVMIPGYTAYDAKKAFDYYESIPCQLVVEPTTITFKTPQAKYNYAQFTIEVEDDQALIAADGRILRCSVLDDAGTKVTQNRRMVFTKGTHPEVRARTLKKGDKLKVLGIPRVNLAVVSWRARNAAQRPEVLGWRLPYEMLIVGLR